MSDVAITCRRCGAAVERGALQSHGCRRPGDASPPVSATDPLVAALSAAAGGLPPVNGHAPLAVDVMRASRRKRDAEARLSAVLAAARTVCEVSATIGFDDGAGRGAPEPEEVTTLRRALAAADGAA